MTKFEQSLAGRTVFLTGHTGFTGNWLTEWLIALDCEVAGYSLEPETTPNLYSILDRPGRLFRHDIANITDHATVKNAIIDVQPSVVFHLAAQPLVRRSFHDPLETFASNIQGTASVLEAARSVDSVEAIVCITTDKVYENRESVTPYSEGDRLGGADPYSASKACAELVASCYQQTMMELGNRAKVATARGGNIIGGGDWSADRIIPDFYRALSSGDTLRIRNPSSTRPWQHVLTACHGYLAIAADLLQSNGADREWPQSWNIGPADSSEVTVKELVDLLGKYSATPEIIFESSDLKETKALSIDTTKAATRLGVKSPWATAETVQRTAQWYANFYSGADDVVELLLNQLEDYRRLVRESSE